MGSHCNLRYGFETVGRTGPDCLPCNEAPTTESAGVTQRWPSGPDPVGASTTELNRGENAPEARGRDTPHAVASKQADWNSTSSGYERSLISGHKLFFHRVSFSWSRPDDPSSFPCTHTCTNTQKIHTHAVFVYL